MKNEDDHSALNALVMGMTDKHWSKCQAAEEE
jgi:hypothetical protein